MDAIEAEERLARIRSEINGIARHIKSKASRNRLHVAMFDIDGAIARLNDTSDSKLLDFTYRKRAMAAAGK